MPGSLPGGETGDSRFADVARKILSALTVPSWWLTAVFEEWLLAAEFSRARITIPRMPALCTLSLGRQTFDTPNHKLTTLLTTARSP